MDMLIDNIEVCLSLLETEKEIQKVDILKPYIGYQYGTAMYSVASIDDKKECDRLIERLSEKKDILKWSKNRKVQMLQLADSIGGTKFLILLLKIKNKFK